MKCIKPTMARVWQYAGKRFIKYYLCTIIISDKLKTREIVVGHADNDIIKFEDADSIVSWYLKYYYRMGYFGIRMPFDFSSLFHKKGV